MVQLLSHRCRKAIVAVLREDRSSVAVPGCRRIEQLCLETLFSFIKLMISCLMSSQHSQDRFAHALCRCLQRRTCRRAFAAPLRPFAASLRGCAKIYIQPATSAWLLQHRCRTCAASLRGCNQHRCVQLFLLIHAIFCSTAARLHSCIQLPLLMYAIIGMERLPDAGELQSQ